MFFTFSLLAPAQAIHFQQLAGSGAITKNDVKKPTVGFCVFPGFGKIAA
jgi:hypothetical protein